MPHKKPLALADADSHIHSAEGLHVIRLPEHYEPLSPILHVVPLQLLAYHTALVARHRFGQTAQLGQERGGGVRAAVENLRLQTLRLGRRRRG